MAGSHIELRKRNQAFQNTIGKGRKLVKDQDGQLIDKKTPLPRWLIGILVFIVCGGVLFELLQGIFNAFYPTAPVKGGR